MKELKISQNETIKDWVLRVYRHFNVHPCTLGQNLVQRIEQHMSTGFSEKEAIKIRQEMIYYINDLFDSPGEIPGISYDEILAFEQNFFPEGFHSNNSCQLCLKSKADCIC